MRMFIPGLKTPHFDTFVRAARLMAESGPVWMVVKPYKPVGTLDQGALAHKLWSHIATHWNLQNPDKPTSPEAVKESLKGMYGVIETYYEPTSGERKAVAKSWSKMNKAERHALITHTLVFMADNAIPDLPELPATALFHRELSMISNWRTWKYRIANPPGAELKTLDRETIAEEVAQFLKSGGKIKREKSVPVEFRTSKDGRLAYKIPRPGIMAKTEDLWTTNRKTIPAYCSTIPSAKARTLLHRTITETSK